MNKLFLYLNENRPDIVWLKGETPNDCVWDTSLPDQQEIIDLINAYDETYMPRVVPSSVTPVQLRTALVLSGIDLTSIEAAINNLPEEDKILASVGWEYALEFERNQPIVNAVGALLGLTDTEIDDIYILAATIG